MAIIIKKPASNSLLAFGVHFILFIVLQGERGFPGAAGTPGSVGPKGLKGNKGAAGPHGNPGPTVRKF